MNTYSFMSISYNLHLSQNNSLQKGERPKLDCSMQEGRIAMLPFVRNPNKNKKTQERKFSSSSFLFLWSNIIFSLSLSLSFWHRFLPPLLLFFLAKQTLTSSLLSLSLSLKLGGGGGKQSLLPSPHLAIHLGRAVRRAERGGALLTPPSPRAAPSEHGGDEEPGGWGGEEEGIIPPADSFFLARVELERYIGSSLVPPRHWRWMDGRFAWLGLGIRSDMASFLSQIDPSS